MFKSSNVISERLDNCENIKTTFIRKPKESHSWENRNITFGQSNFGNNSKDDMMFVRSYPEQREFGRAITKNRQTKKFENQN